MSEHYLTTKSTHDRWNRDLPPQVEVEPGTSLSFVVSIPAAANWVRLQPFDDFLKIDRNKIHTLTGPVAIKGAQPGDTLRVDVVNIQLRGWGWTSITPGLGFLPDVFLILFFLSGN